MQFLTAKALTTGRIRLADFDDASFLTPDLAGLLPRVASTAHQDADAYLGRVRVVMKDGRVLEDTASTRFGRGPTNPMSDAELRDKFTDCAMPMLGEAQAGAAFDAILSLADGDRLDGVLAMISGKEA